MFGTKARRRDELAGARVEIARLRKENARLVKSESNWIAAQASLAILLGAIEGRFVPPALWTVRGEERADVASDETIRQMAGRYVDARDRAREG